MPSANASSAATRARPAARRFAGATSINISRSESSGRDMPTSCVIESMLPPTAKSPSSAS
ncbi:MAG: hypothetical protein EBU67_00770 [Actinobacteria bacterium]|nr:hypothetical protein [Actinomycetota bacterium]